MTVNNISPLTHNGQMLLKLEDVQAQKGSWFRFSPQFPSDNKTKWASGNTFEVSMDTILVDYPVSRNIANQDWVNLDLSNDTNPTLPGVPHPTVAQTGTLQMYPPTDYIIYEISVGMKRGDYFSQLYFNAVSNPPLYQLGSNSVQGGIADPVYRYLGAQYPKDSPDKFPTLFIYTVKQAPKILVQMFMDGGDTEVAGVLYGKATIVFRVNKCKLQQITQQSESIIYIPVPAHTSYAVPSGRVALVTGGNGGDTYVVNPSGAKIGVPSGTSMLVDPNYVVFTGSGSAIITTQSDYQHWLMVQEKAKYIPWFSELTNF